MAPQRQLPGVGPQKWPCKTRYSEHLTEAGLAIRVGDPLTIRARAYLLPPGSAQSAPHPPKGVGPWGLKSLEKNLQMNLSQQAQVQLNLREPPVQTQKLIIKPNVTYVTFRVAIGV